MCFKCAKKHCDVKLFGSWNNWKESVTLQVSENEYKYYDLELEPGHYEYKFNVNEEWVNDPHKEVNENGNHELLVGQNY